MSEFLKEFNKSLEDAKNLEIDMINFGTLNVINNLKKIERTGKKVRLQKLKCKKIKTRTIYDHVHSVAQIVDFLLDNKIIECDVSKLAKMIVYHDLCEVLITDYPRHTKNYDLKSTSIMNMFSVDKKVREQYALNFLWLFANENQKQAIELLNEDNEEQRILWLIDKIDPIINTWRYMYVYRKKLNSLKYDYIEIMDDFFTNPALDKILNMDTYEEIKKMIKYLRNPDNAREYLKTGVIDDKKIEKDTKNMIIKLVEKIDLFYK